MLHADVLEISVLVQRIFCAHVSVSLYHETMGFHVFGAFRSGADDFRFGLVNVPKFSAIKSVVQFDPHI
jgi:hypothetical protein